MTILKQPAPSIFETFSVDFIGPLSKTDNEKRFIIVVVEYFSHWLLPKSTAFQTTDIAVVSIEATICTNFGSPETVLSDQGPAFTSSASQDRLHGTRSHPRTTAAYSLQSYGRAVKIIQSINHALTCCIQEFEKECDQLQQNIVNEYSIQAASEGLWPYELMYGIPPTQLSSHLRSCTHLLGTPEKFAAEAENNERGSCLVQVMAIYSRRAERFVPLKSIDKIQFRVAELIIVARP